MDPEPKRGAAHVVSATHVSTEGFRWIALKKLVWKHNDGKERPWEVVERTTKRGEYFMW